MKQKQIMKKKLNQKLLLFDYNQLTREEILATLKEITVNLQKHFKRHIGFDNGTSPYEIFEAATGLDPNKLSIYKKDYWWNIIKKILSVQRSSEELFVVHRGHVWFVLQNVEECKQYESQINRTIEGLKDSKIKARHWVKENKWRNI